MEGSEGKNNLVIQTKTGDETKDQHVTLPSNEECKKPIDASAKSAVKNQPIDAASSISLATKEQDSCGKHNFQAPKGEVQKNEKTSGESCGKHDFQVSKTGVDKDDKTIVSPTGKSCGKQSLQAQKHKKCDQERVVKYDHPARGDETASCRGVAEGGERVEKRGVEGACKARSNSDKENRVIDNKLERATLTTTAMSTASSTQPQTQPGSRSPLQTRSGTTSSNPNHTKSPVPTPRAPTATSPAPTPTATAHHRQYYQHDSNDDESVVGHHACGSLYSNCQDETKQLVKCFCSQRNGNSDHHPLEGGECRGGAGGQGHPHQPRSHCKHMKGSHGATTGHVCAKGGGRMGNDSAKHEIRGGEVVIGGGGGGKGGWIAPDGVHVRLSDRDGGGGESDDYLRSVIVAQEKRLRDLNLKNDEEVMILRKEVTKREYEIIRLRHEIHKLKSVLQQATSFNQDNVLPPIDYDQPTNQTKSGRQGVSGESCQTAKTSHSIQVRRYDKDYRSKQLIKSAIMGNDFLKNLDPGQIREIVDSMYPQKCDRGSFVLRQGETGAHLYVSADGEFEIIKDNKILGRMGRGVAFGELAILYNCTRTASIRVVEDAKVWVLDRRVFQQIMMRTGLQRLEDSLQFLKSVPLLQSLSPNVLAKIADVLQVEFFPAEHYIIREGAHGDTFYIISNGSVRVTKRISGTNKEEEVRILKRGDYFGEQALLKEECRSASVIALSPGVECLSLDRGPFIQLIGGLSELKEKRYEGEIPSKLRTEPRDALEYVELDEEYKNIKLEDLIQISTLGIGGFGRVELVQSKSDKTKVYALKCLKKQHIVDTHQQEHVYNEKHIMLACRNSFICRLYRTFRDTKFVYMLMEPCLGGEVWTILRDRGCFDDNAASFIAACVIEALHYLHSHQIVYRDLKPENLLLDAKGYVKMVDFGFSKRLTHNMRTWTFCGTPEYVAPEVIIQKGHDRTVDYWSLGILIFELLSGCPPFRGSDSMKIYNQILEGIDYVSFPRHVSRTAQNLVKRLCHMCPAERIGAQRNGLMDVKKHKWFQGFDWIGLQQKTLPPPIIQEVRNPTDVSNFDFYPQDCKEVPDELSNWDIDF